METVSKRSLLPSGAEEGLFVSFCLVSLKCFCEVRHRTNELFFDARNIFYTKRFMRHIPNLIAGTYHKSFSSGRTAPCVILCYDENGNTAGEYVVKLKGNIETGAAGLLRELLGSFLADELGLKIPCPAIVRVTNELADAITDKRVSESIRQS